MSGFWREGIVLLVLLCCVKAIGKEDGVNY